MKTLVCVLAWWMVFSVPLSIVVGKTIKGPL